ncbi:MAG: transglutaminase family protein [Opitutaceae bacterium]|nr:transglutaminase family protein [Opitutaceae bacterium]
MTLYRLHHTTVYDYTEAAVVLGTHFLHLLPRERPGQTVLAAQLDISPTPDSRRDEVDHFGNLTTTVSITGAHREFRVAMSATVEVSQSALPAATPAWEEIAARSIDDVDLAEFCLPSALAAPDGEIAAYAAASFPAGRPILEALLDLGGRLYADMTYEPGATGSATTASQAFAGRRGVCQDYAHLMVACLRAVRLPARYVSGYLRTQPPPGQKKLRGADQSHAWTSAWAGLEAGWIDFDPTNRLLVREEHVTLAWGRDFHDVSPLRGVIVGGGRHTVRVQVDLDPLLLPL